MQKSTNDYVNLYKAQLEIGDIQIAYERLIKYVMALKAYLVNLHSDEFSFGNISRGYMDYTYFPIVNNFLRNKKLRFGIVLNHLSLRFELWLMGQNADVQLAYWELLKNTKWNQDRTFMPKYSVLELAFDVTPNFNDLEALSAEIETIAIPSINEIMQFISENDISL